MVNVETSLTLVSSFLLILAVIVDKIDLMMPKAVEESPNANAVVDDDDDAPPHAVNITWLD